MNILITGSNGFIGKRLAQRFLDQNVHVVGSGRGATSLSHPNFTYIRGDIANLSSCRAMTTDVDFIVHCAGKAGVWGSRESYFQANVTGTKNLLHAAQISGVKRFINISSPSIYFDYKDQFNLKVENIPKRFSSPYAETKYLAEELVTSANSPDMLTVSLRPRGVIGAGDKNWLPRIIEMKKSGSLIQPGNGENIVDFTSVENLIDLIEICLNCKASYLGRTYNVSNGKPEKLWDIVDESLRMVGLDAHRKRIPRFLAMSIARGAEIFHRLLGSKKEPTLLPLKVGVATYSMTLDISDTKAAFGYEPRVSTLQACQEFVDWWKQQCLS